MPNCGNDAVYIVMWCDAVLYLRNVISSAGRSCCLQSFLE